MFNKDLKQDIPKKMFARWQAHSAPFDFTIIYRKCEDNILSDFLTKKFLNEQCTFKTII